MIIENTQPRMYMCAFLNKHTKSIDKLILKPKENVVDSKLLKSLEAHSGFNARVELGILKITNAKKPKVSKGSEKNEVESTGDKEVDATTEDFLG